MRAHIVLAHPGPKANDSHIAAMAQTALEARLTAITADRQGALARRDTRGTVHIYMMADWGSDGRIKPDAPVYSPFMRHEK
jgi:hypothetical protein